MTLTFHHKEFNSVVQKYVDFKYSLHIVGKLQKSNQNCLEMTKYFAPEVVCVKHVISGGVTEDVPVPGLPNHGVFPELSRHFFHSKRHKEALCRLKHSFYSVILFDQSSGNVNYFFIFKRLQQSVNIVPLLGPHIT